MSAISVRYYPGSDFPLDPPPLGRSSERVSEVLFLGPAYGSAARRTLSSGYGYNSTLAGCTSLGQRDEQGKHRVGYF